MDQVPKVLKPMVDEWTRDGYIVSFKVRIIPDCPSAATHLNVFVSNNKIAPIHCPSTYPGPCTPQLETDEALLIPKARAALERYGHQVVIGNDLHTRKFQVVFVSKRPPASQSTTTTVTPDSPDARFVESWLRIDTPASSSAHHEKEIEEDIVAELVRRHQQWIEGSM